MQPTSRRPSAGDDVGVGIGGGQSDALDPRTARVAVDPDAPDGVEDQQVAVAHRRVPAVAVEALAGEEEAVAHPVQLAGLRQSVLVGEGRRGDHVQDGAAGGVDVQQLRGIVAADVGGAVVEEGDVVDVPAQAQAVLADQGEVRRRIQHLDVVRAGAVDDGDQTVVPAAGGVGVGGGQIGGHRPGRRQVHEARGAGRHEVGAQDHAVGLGAGGRGREQQDDEEDRAHGVSSGRVRQSQRTAIRTLRPGSG